MRRGSLVGIALVSAAVLVGTSACKSSPDVDERRLVIHSSRACPITQSQAFSVVYAAGDFQGTPVSSLFLRDEGATLAELPAETRALVVDISQPPSSIDWRGTVEVPKSGPIDVLVWPGRESCSLSRSVQRRADTTLATFGRHFLVVGGRALDGPQVPHTFIGDLTTGVVEQLPYGLGTRRARPSVTAFSPRSTEGALAALVAGGRDPDSGTPLSTAEVYAPKPDAPGNVGDFEPSRIQLSQARADHGFVVLASGETLLVGGVGDRGETLGTMEIVDPVTQRPKTSGVALLAVPRSRPTVLRLTTNEILVAGGFDSQGQPVPTLEWFSADAAIPSKRPIDLVTGRERAFVRLESGGALAVVAPRDPSPDFKTVWVISADGTLEPAIPIAPSSLAVVRLFEGADGAPLLWTGPQGTSGRGWFRWDPWFGAFQAVGDSPVDGPANDDDGSVSRTDVTANGDSGLALWLDDRKEAGMYVVGWRFATRTRFDAIPSPLLVDTPAGFAPDRPAGLPGSSIRFQPGSGLELGPGASAFLANVTLADFSVELDVVGAAPEVVLQPEFGEELSVGGAQCAIAQQAKSTLFVERRASRVLVTIDGGDERACPTGLDPRARVRLGLRGAQGASSGARNFRVLRR